MAVSIYTGVPGSGKTHALVADVIVPALAKGRRVVTNVAGIKPDETVNFALGFSDSGVVGELVTFDGFATVEPGFFPDPDHLDTSASFCRAGDLFVMDEVRLYWPARGKFAPEVMRFMRFHRHWVDERGVSTDIVLATQMLGDIHLDVRGLTERTFKFKKLTTQGLPERYVWSSWEGSAQRKGEAILNGSGKYRSEIFELYSSFQGGADGVELRTDRRASMWSGSKAKIYIGLTVAGLVLSVALGVWSWKSLGAKGVAKSTAVETAFAARPAAQPLPPPIFKQPPISQAWRIAGMLDLPGRRLVILADRSGVVRYEDAIGFSFLDGRPQAGVVEGERVIASSAAVSQAKPSGDGGAMFGGLIK